MIKECNVILQNELLTVVMYDNKKVQLPTNTKTLGQRTVFVKFENGTYSIVEQGDFEKEKAIKNKLKKSSENKPKIEDTVNMENTENKID